MNKTNIGLVLKKETKCGTNVFVTVVAEMMHIPHSIINVTTMREIMIRDNKIIAHKKRLVVVMINVDTSDSKTHTKHIEVLKEFIT